MIVKRLPIDLPGKADGYLTKYLIPEIVKQRLAQVCSPRGRSRWIAEAIAAFSNHDTQDRNMMLLADGRLREGHLSQMPVRLSQVTQKQLRNTLVEFRKEYPAEDLEISGVFRAAILFQMRNKEGIAIQDHLPQQYQTRQ